MSRLFEAPQHREPRCRVTALKTRNASRAGHGGVAARGNATFTRPARCSRGSLALPFEGIAG